MTRNRVRVVVLCVFLGVGAAIGLLFWAARDREEIVTIEEVPEAARATILREAADGEIAKIERTVKKGQEVYAAEIILGDQEIELAVAPDGAVVHREAEDLGARGAEDVVVSLDEVPPAVRATIVREAQGAAVEELEKKTKRGKTIYAAEFLLDGKEVELWVDPDGKVLSREENEPE